MTLIVCLDNRNGMLFNKRRQSRDVCVYERILQITAGNRLYVSEYSAELFQNQACVISENIFNETADDDFVFAECEISSGILKSVERLIVYRWNRDYPSDVKFPYDAAMELFRKESTYEFQGNSHVRITEEVYIR